MTEQPDQENSSPTPAPRSRRRRLLRRFVIAVTVVMLGYLAAGVALDRFGQVERARPARAIVVLGARVMPNGQPGDSLRSRTLHAAELYRQGMAKYLIFTGGQGDYGRPESMVAGELAHAHGVPMTAILRETRSTSTRENIHYAAEICRRHGWVRVIVVSDPYHLWRARYLFRREGITAYPSPALRCARNRFLFLHVTWTAREVLAVVKDLLGVGH